MPQSASQPVSRSTHRKTKIIATAGPASRSPERVRQLINAGVNVFRLNFSHGSHEEHLTTLHTIREAATELKAHIAVLQDLSGPKIRISNIVGDFVHIEDGAKVELRFSDGSPSNAEIIYVEGLNPLEVLEPGQPVLLSDGIIGLHAEEKLPTGVVCSVLKGGRLRSRVGIAFPDSAVTLPATTEKDLKDLRWGIKNGVDFVAISFVQNAQDVHMLREVIRAEKGECRIIAKIERKRALEEIDDIISASDGLMVARGDLGLELPLEQLPMLQRNLIEKGNANGIPVIVATQMLHSMITSVRPTRAEVSDIAAAVMSGADAVMLSEETAIGEHPVEAVRYLSRIAREAEKSFEFEEYKLRLRQADKQSVPDAVSYAACAAAFKLNASAIVACTESGGTARLVGKYRPQQPLYGATSNLRTLRRLALHWGVIPMEIPRVDGPDIEELEVALRTAKEREHLQAGDRVIVLGGHHAGLPGTTSILEVRQIG